MNSFKFKLIAIIPAIAIITAMSCWHHADNVFVEGDDDEGGDKNDDDDHYPRPRRK